MSNLELAERYNYDEYVPEKFEPWRSFAVSPLLGEPAPDFPLWPLDDRLSLGDRSLEQLTAAIPSALQLAAIWSSFPLTVVEFGSYTNPYCGLQAPEMNAMAERFAPQGVGVVFVYTHEVHPGERFPHLTSMEEKRTHAAALRDELGVARPILLDALDGACHRAYGGMPNMTWILNRAGVPVYKADWTDAESVASALSYQLEVQRRRQQGETLVHFQVERLDYRSRDIDGFYRSLESYGPKALAEFRRVFQ